MNTSKIYAKNAIVSLVTQSLILIGQFVLQTVFVKTLSAAYLGANGLFTNLVSFLSFSELGIGAAITYALYGPIQNRDNKKIGSIMALFKKAYTIIGLIVLILGLILLIFLPKFVKTGQAVPNLRLLFFIYLLTTVSSYFFTYMRTLLIASQNSYINALNQSIFKIIQMVLQIVLLLIYKEYLFFLVIGLVMTILSNLQIASLTTKMFVSLKADMKGADKISKDELNSIKHNIAGSFSSKVGTIIVFGTDNILISKFVGLTMVGLYSNYTLIVQGISAVLNQVYSSVIASLGVSSLDGDSDKRETILLRYMYALALVSAIVVPAFFIGVQSFVKMWFGDSFVVPQNVVWLITLNFLFTQLRQPITGMTAALGLFWHLRIKSLIEALVNLVLSLFFVTYFSLGIQGVLLGTLLSTLLVDVWWEPLVVYRHGFNGKKMSRYWKRYFLFSMLILINLYLLDEISELINIYNWLSLIEVIIVTIISLVLSFILVTWPIPERKFFYNLLKNRFVR